MQKIDTKNIILTGFMGTGKTTVGKILAATLGREFVDTDSLIESRQGRTIPEIFRDAGEAAFRQMEAELARELGAREGLIISTGGRFMLDPANVKALSGTGRVFCLVATPQEILTRISKDKDHRRPLLEVPDPSEQIVELLQARESGYQRFLKVKTNDKSPEKVADDLLDLLQRTPEQFAIDDPNQPFECIAENGVLPSIRTRQQSKKQLRVRGVVIGGAHPLICLPLVAGTKEELMGQAAALVELAPDLVEWRIDGFTEAEDLAISLTTLGELRSILGEIPLIFTCRIDQEGGMRNISQEKRLELMVAAIESGNIDCIDLELCNGREFIDAVKSHAQARRVALILSYHNFKETPAETFIYDKLLAAFEAGADIPKLAFMPKDYADVLVLLHATNRARNSVIDTPLITMSMGAPGAVTRLAGGLFGSDITFAVGTASSAPGQIPITEMRAGMAVLFGAR